MLIGPPFEWTEKKVALLIALATAEDEPSVTAIAARLGTTRGAVTGKIFRLTKAGLIAPRAMDRDAQRDAYHARVKEKLAVRPRRSRRKKKQAETAAPIAAKPSFRPKPDQLCCYPMWGLRERSGRFCGEPVTNHRNYCEKHVAIAFVKQRGEGAEREEAA